MHFMVLISTFLVKNKLPLLNFSVFLCLSTEMGSAQDCFESCKPAKIQKDDAFEAVMDYVTNDAIVDVINKGLTETHRGKSKFRNGFEENFVQSAEQTSEKSVPSEILILPKLNLPPMDTFISHVVLSTQKLPHRPKHFINYYTRDDDGQTHKSQLSQPNGPVICSNLSKLDTLRSVTHIPLCPKSYYVIREEIMSPVSDVKDFPTVMSLNDSLVDDSEVPGFNVSVQQILVSIVLSFVPLTTIIGNVMVIYAVNTEKSLQQVQNHLLVSLATADLLVAITVMPLAIALEISSKWVFGYYMCDIWRFMDVMGCTASILHLCVIALDRYWAISRPFDYGLQRTSCLIWKLIVIVWVLSVVISLPLLTIWRKEGRGPHNQDCDLISNVAYIVYSATGSFYAPLMIMVVLYIRIYHVASQKSKARALRSNRTLQHLALGSVALHSSLHGPSTSSDARGSKKIPQNKNSVAANRLTDVVEENDEVVVKKKNKNENNDSKKKNKRERKSSYSLAETNVDIGPVSAKIEITSKRCSQSDSLSSVMNSRKKAGSKSLISFRKEQKAAKTLGIILGSFIACWLPFFVLYLSGPLLNYAELTVPVWMFKLFTWLGYLNSSCNPIIYTIFNKEFRQAFQKICCRRKKVKLQSLIYNKI